jgi:teichuronic acid biosynthesis glycosyltransferase TuaC
MKVLFVSKGKNVGVSPIIYNQGESLREEGCDVHYHVILGNGIRGYLKALKPLRNEIKKNNYDTVHAHFSYSGFLAALASPFGKRIIVSLMGKIDAPSYKYYLIKFFYFIRWEHIIVKSNKMKMQVNLKSAHIIPNGVMVEKFITTSNRRSLIRQELGFKEAEKIVIFVADPSRLGKNFKLCEESFNLLNYPNSRLIAVFSKSHDEVVKYMVGADVMMLTSFSEGSPNVVKEAMAAGCPIVATNVGDVEFLLADLEGTYVMNTFEKEEAAKLLNLAINFNGRTNGMKRLQQLNLTSKQIAKKIIDLYRK